MQKAGGFSTIVDNLIFRIKISERLFIAISLAFYAAIVIFSAFHHEPWRDEAQSWMLTRDYGILFMFDSISYNGHPLLWHLILHPFARLGFPYATMFITHICLAAAAVFLLLKYAPFSRLTKVFFIFSYFMSYEYSVIARNYCISILLLFAIASFYRFRFDRPFTFALLIILLVNSNVHSLFIGSSLIFIYFLELLASRKLDKIKFALLSLMSATVLGLVLLFLKEPENTYWGKDYFHPENLLTALNKMLLPFQGIEREAQILIALAVMSLLVLSLLKKPYVLLCFLLSSSALGYVFIFKKCNLRHQGLVLILIVFILWISSYYREIDFRLLRRIRNSEMQRALIIIINFCLFVSIGIGARVHYQEYLYAFSGAREAADFIRNGGFENDIIATFPSGKPSGLLPFLPDRKFWYMESRQYSTFVIAKKGEYKRGIKPDKIFPILQENFPGEKNLLFLSSRPVEADKEHFKLLFTTGVKIFYHPEEKFFLYRVIQ
jgi:hypothetical protein